MSNYIKLHFFMLLFIGLSPTIVEANWLLDSEVHWYLNKSLIQGQGDLVKNSYKGKETLPMGEFAIPSKFPITTENVELDIDYEFQPLDKVAFDTPLKFQSKKLVMNVRIGKITFKQEVAEANGSNQIISVVKAECADVKLLQDDSKTNLSGNIRITTTPGSVDSTLTDSKIFWPENSWKIVKLDCTGVEGFEKIAKYEIEKFLKKPDNMQNPIEAKLKDLVKRWSEKTSLDIFSIRSLPLVTANLNSRIVPLNISEDSSYIRIATLTQFDYLNISSEPHVSVPLNLKDTDIKSKAFTQFSQKFTFQGLEKLWQNGNLIKNTSTKNWKEFNDLLKNKAVIKAVWPDLASFPENTDFKLLLTITNRPQFSKLNPGDKNFIVKTYIAANIMAPKNGQYYPYAQFFSYVRGDVNFKVEKGNLLVNLSNLVTRYGGPKGGILPQYKRKFNIANDYIDNDTITTYLQGLIEKETITIPLPEWKVTPSLTLKAKELQQSQNLFYLLWE